MAATARVTILMEPSEKRALEARAKREQVSVGELVRRSVLASRREEDEALRVVLDMLLKSNAAARDSIDRTLAAIERREKERPKREAQVRAQAIAEFKAWPKERRAHFQKVFGHAHVDAA